jgi:hypothetical protein
MTYKPIIYKEDTATARTHDGVIDTIVSKMWKLINRDYQDPIIINKAITLKGNDKNATIRKVYDWVVANVPYKNDPEGVERLTAPIHFVQRNQIGGDCDDMVMIIAALLSALGIKTRIKVISWRKKEFTHVTLEANNGSNWIELDDTMGMGGYNVKRLKTGKLNNKNPLVINRDKIYMNPVSLKVQTLEDNPEIYRQAGLSGCCGGGMSDNYRSDCKCGGRCNKCRSKNKAENQNINVNPILIGNDISNIFKKMAYDTYGASPKTIERQVPVERIIERPIEKQIIVERQNEPNINISPMESIKETPNEKYKLASAIKSKGNTYLYTFGM